jgi:Flp pilus assembly protein TadG
MNLNNIKNKFAYKKNEDGTAAIEFAFFAIPFFLLIMGIVEIGILAGTSIVMEGGTKEAARLIRTGQITDNSTASRDLFRNTFCDEVKVFINCATAGPSLVFKVLELDDSTGNGFDNAASGAASLPDLDVVDASGNLTGPVFAPGSANSKVIVRIAHERQLLTPLAAPLLSNRPNNKRLIQSTAIVRNEPYAFR